MLFRLVILSMLYTKVILHQEDLFPTSEYNSVWPKPVYVKQFSTIFLYDSAIFKINVTNHNCDLIEKALIRYNNSISAILNYTKEIRQGKAVPTPSTNRREILKGLRITLDNPCEFYPHHAMDESCKPTASFWSIRANKYFHSIWGIIRGLETFSQLFSISKDKSEIFLRAVEIFDQPRYPHRGLMLDTSRNYVPVSSLVKSVYIMATLKLNALHWRLADEESLIDKMAGRPVPMYSRNHIREIIHHARILGIRVIPEFDLPLHVGPIDPQSQDTNDVSGMHPFSKATYAQFQKLYGEVHDIFPETYLHLGDVDLANWVNDPKIRKYIETHHKNLDKLHYLYLRKIHAVLRNGSIPIVWRSSKDVENNLPPNFIIQTQITKGWLIRSLQQIKKGRQVISSININQRHLRNILWNRYKEYYEEDPRMKLYEISKDQSLEENLLGLEAIVKSDVLDENGNIMRGAWVAISIIAEVLWSDTDGKIPLDTLHRMAQHDIRLKIRGAYTGSTDSLTPIHKDQEHILEPSGIFDHNLILKLRNRYTRDCYFLVSSLD